MRVRRVAVIVGAAMLSAAAAAAVATVPAASTPAASDPVTAGAEHGASAAGAALARAGSKVVSVGTFAPAASATDAFTYDPELVPPGAEVAVGALELGPSRTVTLLAVTGLVPEHRYSAHVHAAACGTEATAAGPHYQHTADPVTPSVDPRYANRRNEVWLTDRGGADGTAYFTPDAAGTALVVVSNPWQYGEKRGGSVVVHAGPTKTAQGEAGTAGPRVGCLTVAF